MTEQSAPLRVDLLEASFGLLAPRGEELVERFYTRLFTVAPDARAMFPDEMAGQKRALLGSLGMILSSLRAPEQLSAYLEVLGRNHVDYGAIEAHYDVVGSVLVETMAEMAGPAWNSDLQDAWTTAYGAIKGIMLAGASAVADGAAAA